MKHLTLKFNKKEGDFTLSVNQKFISIIRINSQDSLIPSLENHVTVAQAKTLNNLMIKCFKDNNKEYTTHKSRISYEVCNEGRC